MVAGVPGLGDHPALVWGEDCALWRLRAPWWHCAPVPWGLCPWQIKKYEKLDSEEERSARSRHIFDHYIMKELLACSHVSALRAELPQWCPQSGWERCARCAHYPLSSEAPTSLLGAPGQAFWMGIPP